MILVLAQAFPPDTGGIQTSMGALAAALARTGETVLVLADRARTAAPAAPAAYAVRRFGGLKPLRRRYKAWVARRLVARGGVTGIVADSWKSLEFLPRPGVPTLVLAHGTEFPARPRPAKAARIRRSLAAATVIAPNSAYTAALVRTALTGTAPDGTMPTGTALNGTMPTGTAPTGTTPTGTALAGATLAGAVPDETVPAGITPTGATPTGAGPSVRVVHPAIVPQPDPTDAARAEAARIVGGDGPVLLTLCRLEPRKGVDAVIRALPALVARHPRLVHVVAGDGPDAPRLRALADECGVAPRLRFVGRVSDDLKAALLAAADVFAMPARREGDSVEGFGLAYLEAAWHGTPSLAGREGGAADAVRDGETGLLCDGADPAAVGAALARLLDDPALRARLGAAARGAVREGGGWDAVAGHLLGLLGMTGR